MVIKVSVIMTKDMVLVVGGIFADCSADEARGSIKVAMLLDSTHMGVFLDYLPSRLIH